jgi:hypothetical protein
MTADEYRRRAIRAEQRSAGASIPEVKSFYDDIARHWRSLADEAERLVKRYGTPMSAEFFQTTRSERPTLQQQQQEQPKKA